MPRPQDPENNVIVISLGFLFVLYNPNFELKKSVTLKHQWVQTKRSPNRSLLFLAERPGKRQPTNIENFFF